MLFACLSPLYESFKNIYHDTNYPMMPTIIQVYLEQQKLKGQRRVGFESDVWKRKI